MLMTGSTSSAVAVALNKLAQREKVLYVVAISGSNDTTGKDCVRYGFRQCFYGETAADAIGPVLLKAFGKNKKAAFMTPDYTYGHTVTKSVNDYLAEHGGWTMVTNQVSPLGASDYQLVPAQHRQLRRRRADQRELGPRRGAVDPAGQAVRHPGQDEAGDPLPDPVPRREVGPEIMQGVYAATDFWWTLEDKYPLAKMFVEAFEKKYGYKPEWGANNAYMQFALWARGGRERRHLLSAGRHQVLRDGRKTFESTVGEVYFRAADHQLVRPVVIVRGKKPCDMKNKEDYWEVTRGPARRGR